MYKYLIVLAFVFSGLSLSAQFKPKDKSGTPAKELKGINGDKDAIKPQHQSQLKHFKIQTIDELSELTIHTPIQVYQVDQNNMPTLIKGNLEAYNLDLSRQAYEYLAAIADFFEIDDPSTEWKILKIDEDKIGMHHIHLEQVKDGVAVYDGKIILHAKHNRIESMTGRGFPTPSLNTTPLIDKDEIERRVVDHLKSHGEYKEITGNLKQMTNLKQMESELVIYHIEGRAELERLVYHVDVYENLGSHKSMIVDANSGEILKAIDLICKAHSHLPPPDGPTTATATDLNGSTRTLNTYEVGGDFVLLDASRPMFSESQSVIPNEPVGAVWTLDAFDETPQGDNFDVGHVVSSNNQWNSATAVSAHYNAGIAYEYFLNVHNRNSINGSGGNIISIINVTDENDNSMDNAFWNGVAMFYGNGATDFLPLAGGLDVAGHEMSHGVVQATANLRYEGESGALNESFADIFGAMMDRDDYKIGEDVVKISSFPTGALRDMANPNNGGSQLGDRGWQPAHVNEQYFGDLDLGGVHINSGIVNKAFHLFAETVGKDKAEQVYYRALTQYLTQSSQFVDARNAVVMSASDLYGATESDAAANAFSSVGIGEGQGGNYQNDAGENPGEDFIIYADEDLQSLKLANASLEVVLDPASINPPKSRPSITDDGSVILFVNNLNQIEAIYINWDDGQVNREVLQDQQIWDNVAISKDGNRFAAVQSAIENKIQVFDFNLGWYAPCTNCDLGFVLTNPTYTEGISTGDVLYADAMEFDITGELLVYDAYSEITSSQGQTVGFWDIGFLEVFNNATGNWSNGNINKLFGQLAEGISIGNPTFAKNSPYILAFDYLEGSEFAILGVNAETGDVSQIYENSSISYPAYTGDDNQMIFTSTSPILGRDIGILNLNADKISTVANSEGVLIESAQLGNAFRNGLRPLTNNDEVEVSNNSVKVFPNPTTDFVLHQYESKTSQEAFLEVVDVEGRVVMSKKISLISGENRNMLDIHELAAGNYIINLKGKELSESAIFSKI